jgi:hypothetical protein
MNREWWGEKLLIPLLFNNIVSKGKVVYSKIKYIQLAVKGEYRAGGFGGLF